MYQITELKGTPHCFNLSNGNALFLVARQCVALSDELAKSPEIARAEKLGLINITKVAEATTTKATKNKGGKN